MLKMRGILTAMVLALVTVASTPLAPAPDGPFGNLPFHYDLYTFRADGGRTAVVATVAVPVGELRGKRVDGQRQYRFDLSFVLADTAKRTVITSRDSASVRMPRPSRGQHLLHTYVEVESDPSPSTVHRVVVTDPASPGTGQLYTGEFAIPDYSGSELMLSDVALGLPDPRGGWTRPGTPLSLLPTSEFPESAFEVYYEIYNMADGAGYETEVAIRRLDKDDGRTIRTRFTGEAEVREDGAVAELRLVESALPRGEYELMVTVTDLASGQSVSRGRNVEVRGWRGGTTLVPALEWQTRIGSGNTAR